MAINLMPMSDAWAQNYMKLGGFDMTSLRIPDDSWKKDYPGLHNGNYLLDSEGRLVFAEWNMMNADDQYVLEQKLESLLAHASAPKPSQASAK